MSVLQHVLYVAKSINGAKNVKEGRKKEGGRIFWPTLCRVQKEKMAHSNNKNNNNNSLERRAIYTC